ncbi:hypothetical protein WMW72_23550 [Paenibacillus filicis]|uniref:Uncharacterized protein n=1 Tax=Paenibacillus filicis TaxID=669464 RepID=A0ABU9DPV3_9BACL
MTSIIMDKYNYYAYIGVFDKKDYEHLSLIMDTNTAINLEKYYYKPKSLNNNSLEATRDFLLTNFTSDTIFGFALQEACWDYNLASINDVQFQKMSLALENQYSWNKEKIISHAQSPGIAFNGSPYREKVTTFTSILDHLHSNPLLAGSYASVLKIMLLQKRAKSNKLKLIDEYVHFVNYELMADLALETQVAFYYLLGNPNMQEIGDRIFKFDSKKVPVLLNAWNTAWDFFYLRLLQRSFFENSFLNSISPKLVTADKGIIGLASLCSLEGVISTIDAPLPLISFNYENIRPEYMTEAERINKDLYFGSIQRELRRREIPNLDLHVKTLIHKLEQELLSVSEL